MRLAHAIHSPILRLCMDHKAVVVGFAACVLVVAFGMIAPYLGSEFVPRLSEGAIVVGIVRLPGTDLAECARAAGIANTVAVSNVDDFVSAVREGLASDELACVVAKVEAVGPAGYLVDTHLLEDRFMFARAMRRPPGDASDVTHR